MFITVAAVVNATNAQNYVRTNEQNTNKKN